MKTRRTIKGTSAGGVVEEAYTPSNPPPYPVVTNGNYPKMTVGKATNADNATNATNATNIVPDENGAVNPGGRGSGTVGDNSTAVGNGASATKLRSTALGCYASASGTIATALGNNASASGYLSTAVGKNASAGEQDSTALGSDASAIGVSSTALGSAVSATADYSTAVGAGASAGGLRSTALGNGASAGGLGSTALGDSAIASVIYSSALGNGATAAGDSSTALGVSASAGGFASTALGNNASAGALRSTAVGNGAKVSESDSDVMQLGSSTLLSELRCKVNITEVSDKRDKTDISDITNALAFLEKLNPVTFVSNDRVNYISEEDKQSENYRKYGLCDYDRVSHAAGTKKGERRRCGLLAQEVVAAMQEIYGTDNYANIVNDNFHDLAVKPSDVENKYTLAYANLVPFLIGAIKELKNEFNAKIKSLEDKLNDNN